VVIEVVIDMNTTSKRTMTVKQQEEVRLRVVRAIRDRGISQAEAVRVFGVSKSSVIRWMAAVRGGGERRLVSKKRGRKPGGGALKGWQAATISNLIRDRHPEQLKLPFALWTRESVQELIAKKFQVHVSLSTVGRYLRRWGFTPQKPVRRAYERCPKAVQKWLDTEYPQIKAQAKILGAEIHWGDQMGLRSDHQTGTTYGVKGRTPVIPGTGKRFRCNMMSTITNQGKLAFMVFTKSFTAAVMIEFLSRLIKSSKMPVFLIVDGHPVHRSKKVQGWLAQHSNQIQMFRLPAYSPELNPDELLNQDTKSNALGRRRPTNQAEMIDDVRSHLRSTQKQPHVVRNFFQEEHVAYAA
jgi:transposase